jgi:hypothetical protein
MKVLLTVAVMLVGSAAANTAFAQAMNQDDLAWVNRCVSDNAGGASASVVRAYCICMNEKMDSGDSRSITAFEQANPSARAACDRQSGWR